MLPKDCRWKAIKDLQGAHPPGFFEMINQPRQRQAQSSLFGSTDVIGRQLWNVGRGLLRLDVRQPDYLALSASTGVRRGGLVGRAPIP